MNFHLVVIRLVVILIRKQFRWVLTLENMSVHTLQNKPRQNKTVVCVIFFM